MSLIVPSLMFVRSVVSEKLKHTHKKIFETDFDSDNLNVSFKLHLSCFSITISIYFCNNFCCTLVGGKDWRKLGIASPQELRCDTHRDHGMFFETFERVKDSAKP